MPEPTGNKANVASEPQWCESDFGKVLVVRCAACSQHPGHRYPTSYSSKREACPGCNGSAWHTLATMERR